MSDITNERWAEVVKNSPYVFLTDEAMEKFSDMYDVSKKHLCVLGEEEVAE